MSLFENFKKCDLKRLIDNIGISLIHFTHSGQSAGAQKCPLCAFPTIMRSD